MKKDMSLTLSLAPSLHEYLESLLDCANRALTPCEEDDDLPTGSIASVEDLIARLNIFRQLDIQRMIRPRLVREERLGSTTHWYEIGHVAARLLSYELAVDSFLTARETWPELFDTFEVAFIPSSKPMIQPLSPQHLPVNTIITKVALNPDMRTRLQHALSSVQNFELDQNIATKWHESFRPVVHAEVLLLDWLKNTEGGTHSERFFARYKFIGTSKPPCRLCSFYFDEDGTDVKLQPSHMNLYLSWRMPDVRASHGENAAARKKDIMFGMRGRICTDIIQTLVSSRTVSRECNTYVKTYVLTAGN